MARYNIRLSCLCVAVALNENMSLDSQMQACTCNVGYRAWLFLCLARVDEQLQNPINRYRQGFRLEHEVPLETFEGFADAVVGHSGK